MRSPRNFRKNLQIPKNIFFGKYYVTGQTFLSSKGQIFLSSFSLTFFHFDPPFFFLFFSNFLSAHLIIGSTFMRLAECNLEIKRLLFSPFISAYFGFKGTNRKEQVNRKNPVFTLVYTKFSQRSKHSWEGWVYGLLVHLELLVHLSYKAFLGINCPASKRRIPLPAAAPIPR